MEGHRDAIGCRGLQQILRLFRARGCAVLQQYHGKTDPAAGPAGLGAFAVQRRTGCKITTLRRATGQN